MDTRKVSPAIRRRIGVGTTNYGRAQDGVIRSSPMGTDWAAIEAAFEAQAQVTRAAANGLLPIVEEYI